MKSQTEKGAAPARGERPFSLINLCRWFIDALCQNIGTADQPAALLFPCLSRSTSSCTGQFNIAVVFSSISCLVRKIQEVESEKQYRARSHSLHCSISQLPSGSRLGGRASAGAQQDPRYWSHSMGSRYFFRLLQSLHAGTVLPRTDLPPRMSGTIWSMVSSAGGNFRPQ